jgi:hypothetical protein
VVGDGMIGRFDDKKQGDLGGTKPVFMLMEPKSRPPRSQSTRSSVETANHGGAKGCRKVETL